MRACVQRVSRAAVDVGDETISSIRAGLLVLLGISTQDSPEDAAQLAQKIVELRIFADDEGKMNRSLLDLRGEMLVVSQFTLWGDCRKGRRPSFIEAARPETAEPLYEYFVAAVKLLGVSVKTGRFRAEMQVTLTNDGPVTLLLDSQKLF
ncbi:MAG: D-aminoacyl-tRNA deacylase [Planctomycetota bacterium]|nr:D-aminoacyl-tRNA deacylase [Planctomycetota bacterium]